MLLRLQSGFQCRSFTEMQEAAQLKAEVGQSVQQIVWISQSGSKSHIYRITIYIQPGNTALRA